MGEFVQEFRRVVRDSGYKRRLLIKEFKIGINGIIRRKLIKAECSPKSIKQWYKRTTNLDKDWRESKREKEKLRERREIEAQALRLNTSANTGRAQR